LRKQTDPLAGGVGLYARVSSRDQCDELDRQVTRLDVWAAQGGAAVVRGETEVGSGMNGARRKVRRLLADPRVATVVVEHRDRLGRMNTGLVEAALSAHGRRLVVLDAGEVTDDLVRDMAGVLTSFFARLYRRRSAWNRAIKALGCAQRDVGPAALSVPAVRMVAVGKRLRVIGDPVVAGAPAGVRIRTRIYPTAAEAEALAAVGELLGSVYRRELAVRVGLGCLDRKAHAVWRAQRKQALTAVSSSRWAGAITRAVEDQYQLGMRGLVAQVADLRAAVDVLEQRCGLRPGELAPVAETATHGRSPRRCRGYRSTSERFTKTRRLAALRSRLSAAEAALVAGRPSITVGGKRLWRNRNHLDAADMAEQQWRDRWDAARMFLTADGESGKAGGNETTRVDESGRLRIKVPAALADDLGSHVEIAAPVRFIHRGGEWADRVAGRAAVRYDISYDPARGRWYLDASWKTSPEPVAELDELRDGAALGVDLNADHLACWVLDASGNPVGQPVTIPIETAGLKASRRDGRVRAAISRLLDHAHQNNCSAIVVENLDFADARATGRETLGRGGRGKRLRRTVAGIPTRKFRARLTGMASRRGVAIIGVDASYTSRWGAQHWQRPLATPRRKTTRHDAASVAIGRRALGYPIRRRTAPPHRDRSDRGGHRTVQAAPDTGGRDGTRPSRTGTRTRSAPPTRT